MTIKGPISSASYSYKTLANFTPSANVTATPVLGTNGQYNVTIGSTSIITANIVSIKFISNLNNNNTITISSGTWTTTGNGTNATTTFTTTLYAGSYKVVILTTPYGYVNISSFVNISTTIPDTTTPQ